MRIQPIYGRKPLFYMYHADKFFILKSQKEMGFDSRHFVFLSNCSFFECQGFFPFVARVTNDKRKVPRRCARVSISEKGVLSG